MRKSVFASLLVFPALISCATIDNPASPSEANSSAKLALLSNPDASDSLALGVALALSSQTLRTRLLEDLRDSPFPDHSIHLRSYLTGARGHDLMALVARNLGRSPEDFQKFEASLPELTLQLDRPLDRVTWNGTPDLVVYASTILGEKRLLAGPTTRGFNTDGAAVSVPIWEAGPGPYLAILPTNVNFGSDPEGQRLVAQRHTERVTVSTREAEREREKNTFRTNSTMLPCDPPCGGGGGASPDGIAMPSPYTAAYCFGWTSWGVPPVDASNDIDNDGIKQDCEYQLAYQFRPQMARNSHEDAPDREPYWSVTRVPGSLTGVRIFYALSYYRDAGEHTTGWTSHDGDSEFVIVELQNNMNPGNYRLWQMTSITLSAHWNAGSADHTATYAASDLEYPVSYLGRPRVWESWDKHANYRSKDICNNTGFDVCTTSFTGTVYDDLEVIPSANLGNEYDRTPFTRSNLLVDCLGSRNPGFGMPGFECYWSSHGGFLGWHNNIGQQGATDYFNMLYFYSF